MTAPHCRHRRVRRLPATAFLAAVLILTLISGLRVGTALGSADVGARTVSTCQEAPLG